MQQILILFFLATFVEGFVKYIVDGLGEKYREKVKPYIPYFTLVLGLALAINFRLDVFSIFENPLVSTYPLVSYLITGVVIGRGSNYVNDIVSKFKMSTSASSSSKTVDNPVDPA